MKLSPLPVILLLILLRPVQHAQETPRPVLSVSPHSWLTEGDSVTLSCEVTNSSTVWTFIWYRYVLSSDDGHIIYKNSSRGSGGSYTLSPAALNHTGVYTCNAKRDREHVDTDHSLQQPLWITGESPPVSLIINPNRSQHFNRDSLSLSCEDQSHFTGWTVRRYSQSAGVVDCSKRGSVTGSTCNISSLSISDTGVYWCESQSGENSNPVNITVHDVNVILESPVHPVTEGHPLTLRCLHRNKKPSNLQTDFYKDGSVLQTQPTGEMIIHKVSKSDEGSYHCKPSTERESPKSWVSVKGSPKDTISIQPGNHVYRGERVTLRCDIQGGGDTEWTYSWYKDKSLYTDGEDRVYTDSTMQEISIRSVRDSDSGVYTCRGQRRDSQSSEISVSVTLTVSETPRPVLSVSPQSWMTVGESVTLSCEVKDSSTGWTFSWYTHVTYKDNTDQISYKEKLLSHSSKEFRGFYTLTPAAFKHTGVYVCRGKRGEPAVHTHYSNPQPLWITGESPPVSLNINPKRPQHFTGDSLSLSCEDQSHSTGWTVRRYTHSERVSDCSWWGSVTGSTCKISSLSTSHTGVYWCGSESGENSNPVNITVHGLGLSDGSVALGLGLAFLFIVSLILIILLWFYKKKKEKQPETRNWTTEQNQSRSGAEDSQSGHIPLQAGEAAAESGETTYAQVTKKKETNTKDDVKAEPNSSDVTYAELEMKQKTKAIKKTEKASVDDDTVYSEVKLNTE